MRSIVRKTVLRSAMLLGAVGAAGTAGGQVGCSSSGVSPESVGNPGTAPDQGTGSIGMQLTLPGGEQLNTVSWTLKGPNGASTVVQSGSVNLTSSASINFLVGGIAAGGGYTVSLTGTTSDGLTTCTGSSAQFAVTARMTTSVSVQLQCAAPAADAGSAQVNGTTFDCATSTSASASPGETTVGNSVSVSGSAIGPNPGALSYSWSAPSGTFDTPSAQSANFTCTAPGMVTLTLTVGDGPVPDGGSCSTALDTTTVTVACDGHLDQAAQLPTATKIKHLIVIFNENISFDHYFGTYPSAQNNAGETPFTPAPGTPIPNNLIRPLNASAGFTPIGGVDLLGNNPTASNPGNGASAINPFRLAKQYAETSSQGHNYMPEQQASDNGKIDLFPEFTGHKGPPPPADAGAPPATQTTGMVMAYYDGNTLGTYWNYAQQYAVNDNMWTTNFGPSTPGAVNLISGQTDGVVGTVAKPPSGFNPSHVTPDGTGGYALIGDIEPLGDMCSNAASDNGAMSGPNVGNLLNARNVTWGWFNGGFNLGVTNGNSTTGCARSTPQTVPFSTTSTDYVPHHQPFQYYPSTANLSHDPPSSTAAIGHSLEIDGVTPEPANHQYDTTDFFNALSAGNLPAVVYLKAPAFQDGHPGNSNPMDEQNFVASVVTALQGAQEWSTSAVIVTYDDSDGWYDHQGPPIVNMSNGVADALNGTALCNSGVQQNADGGAATTMLNGVGPDGGAIGPVLGRCAYGSRVPLMVISPFAKRNYIDHTLVDQTSVLRFIEDNWLSGQRIQPGGSFDTVAGTIQNMLSGI